MKKSYPVERHDKRVPMEVSVQIAGHPEMPGAEMTFTENVSRNGARVLTSRRWRQHDMLMLTSPSGFHSPGRVAYCERAQAHAGNYAIGVELLEPTGRWVVGK
jgi:hypothetical protein